MEFPPSSWGAFEERVISARRHPRGIGPAYDAVKDSNLTITKTDDGTLVPQEFIISTLEGIEDPKTRSGSFRFAVVADPDDKIWLELASVSPLAR
jgi:hypothetical protein